MSPCPWLYASYICPMQITGIIGVKAYRCLGNNRLVIVFLFIMTAIMWSLEGLHLANYTASRSRYGTADRSSGYTQMTEVSIGVCQTTSSVGYVSLIMLADFVETTILCACCECCLWCSLKISERLAVSFVVWRSYKMKACTLPSNSTDSAELYERNEAKDAADATQYPRGWWDYVPDARANAGNRFRQSSRSVKQAFIHWFRRLWSSDGLPPSIAYQRKPSLPGEFPLPQPPRRPPSASAPFARRFAHACYSFIVAALHRWGRHTSGRQLFQKMLRNEVRFNITLMGCALLNAA